MKTIGINETCKELQRMQTASQKVISATIKDFKRRGPSWVVQEVVKEYNIKKAEITQAKKGGGGRKAGSIGASGETLESAAILYAGRVLTPVHFRMTPKVPKQAYTLKAEIKKGEKKTLGKVKKLTKQQRKNIGRNFTRQGTKNSAKSPVMLMYTGNKQSGGINYIPFQRKGKERNNLKAIKTVSVPQMIENKKVKEGIKAAINEKLGSRFDHYVEQYLTK